MSRHELADAVGKTISAVRHEMQDHPLDGPAQDGEVVLTFTDGTELAICGYWCNDDTAATEWEWRP